MTNVIENEVAYNRAIDATDAEILIFAHHDVYLPRGWEKLLTRRLRELEACRTLLATFDKHGLLDRAAASAPETGTPQQNKMKTCNADAKTKELKGDERKKFMSECLKAK